MWYERGLVAQRVSTPNRSLIFKISKRRERLTQGSHAYTSLAPTQDQAHISRVLRSQTHSLSCSSNGTTTYSTPPMKAFSAIIFIFSLATFVFGQQLTTTNAYVSHTIPRLLAVNPHQGRVNL